MKFAVSFVAVLALASACKKKEAAVPATGSGSGVAATTADAAVEVAAPLPPLPAPALALDAPTDDADQDPSMSTVFSAKIPRLPAISADGTLIANYVHASGMPSVPMDTAVAIAKIPTGELVQELPIITVEESMEWAQAGEDNWLTPAVKKTLQTRGAAIMKRLEGFHSLTRLPVEQNKDGDPAATKFGDLTLESNDNDDMLATTLRGAKGQLIHRASVEAYSKGNRGEPFENAPCTFSPRFNAAYRDTAKPDALYIEVDYRWQEGCDDPLPTYIAWSIDPKSTTPTELVEDLVARQFDMIKDDELDKQLLTPDAIALSNRALTSATDMTMPALAGTLDGHDDSAMKINLSRDGKSAWASTLTTLRIGDLKHGDNPEDWRASDMLVQTPAGWRIAALAWTSPTDNATVNKDAKAGKLTATKLGGDAGDASLNAAFAKLTTEGVKYIAKDLVAIGSGPGERTVGAAAFTKAWNAAWKGKTTLVSSVARLAPSGTTGAVAATIELQKSGYKIPFSVFAVFDKDANGAWTLVHIHFAV